MADTIKQFDKRVAARYVNRGEISQKDIDSKLKALPDEADNADWVSYDLEEEMTESEVQTEEAAAEAAAAEASAATPAPNADSDVTP